MSTLALREVSYPRVVTAVLISIAISCSWLVFPYLVQGKKLLQDVGDGARLSKAATVSRYLTRHLVTHKDLELSATFATNEFFQYVDNAGTVGQVRPDQNFIFYVSENIHTGSLSFDLPEVTLHIGDEVFKPNRAAGPSNAEHHRVTIYSFPKRSPAGDLIDLASVDSVRLYVANKYLGSPTTMTFVGRWEAPFELPEELTSRADIGMSATLALSAGLLSSVLTPCLLQLVVVFSSIVSGFSTVPGSAGGHSAQLPRVIRKKLMQIAFAFILGLTALYVLAGALIGVLGHQAQMLFAEHSRNVAIGSGLLVIAMGLWVGLRGQRDLACKLVDRKALAANDRKDAFGAILVSMGYALGCTACFGGAIVATLIIYVGSIGSASIGASIMLCFSIGVAIPFLLSAWYLSRMDSVLVFLAQKAKTVSLISMVLIIAFGLILVTDNFHTVSDMIYPYLGLGR